MNWPSAYDLNKGIEDMEKYIIKIHLRDVYYRERPTNEDEWGEFINKAMNTEEYDFYERWNEYDCSANRTYEYGIAETLALLNKIDKLYDDIYGEKWAYDALTYKKVVNMYAYLYVNKESVEWLMLNKAEYDAYADEMDADDSEDDDEEDEEEYNGSKDFPPNETDETCPICLEAYDRELGRLQDGIRNSTYESNCPHWCCCMCLDEMYKQSDGDKCRCPICKRDITDWMKEQYDEDEDDDDIVP